MFWVEAGGHLLDAVMLFSFLQTVLDCGDLTSRRATGGTLLDTALLQSASAVQGTSAHHQAVDILDLDTFKYLELNKWKEK